MHFVKVHGAGNDFVLLPDLNDTITLDAGFVRALCAPHLGLGADGVIRAGGPREGVEADVFMDYWNADGTVSEMCGNGVRCVAKYMGDRSLSRQADLIRVDTRCGVKPVAVTYSNDGKVLTGRVDMGTPEVGKIDVAVDVDGRILNLTTLSMGNPHAVMVVDDLDAFDLDVVGPALQSHEWFPNGTNVEAITVESRERVRGRIWERGVGETLASGTGGSAMAAAAHLLGLAGRDTTVVLPGGELAIEWTETSLLVTGPATEVATGELDAVWLSTIR